jgi:hypothetical protein
MILETSPISIISSDVFNLKVGTNEKQEGPGSWQMIDIGPGQW